MHEQIRTLIKPAKANGKAASKTGSKSGAKTLTASKTTLASKKPPRVPRVVRKKSRK
jgi:hypothetical protein